LPARDKSDIASCLTQAAGRIQFFQAGRWALGQLRPSVGWPRLRTRWTNEPQLPDLTEAACRQATCDEAANYQQSANRINPVQATQLFDSYSQRFSDPNFFADRCYLVWFSGKDLFAAFLDTVGIPLTKGFYDGLLNAAAKELCNLPPQTLPKNFRQLADLVTQL
jgi:hypothetical protein